MRSKLLKGLMICAAAVAVSSCDNSSGLTVGFPPLADLKVDKEPAYPEAALLPGDAGKAAEDAWWNSVLLWGREHHDRVARICTWARDLKMKMPDGYCG